MGFTVAYFVVGECFVIGGSTASAYCRVIRSSKTIQRIVSVGRRASVCTSGVALGEDITDTVTCVAGIAH